MAVDGVWTPEQLPVHDDRVIRRLEEAGVHDPVESTFAAECTAIRETCFDAPTILVDTDGRPLRHTGCRGSAVAMEREQAHRARPGCRLIVASGMLHELLYDEVHPFDTQEACAFGVASIRDLSLLIVAESKPLV